MRLWILSGAIVLVAACAGQNGPNASKVGAVIGDNNMVAVAPDLTNLPEKLRLLVGAIGRSNDNCTVFHLGHGLAVSAGHCMHVQGDANDQPCQSLSVAFGSVGTQPALTTSRCIRVLTHQNTPTGDYAFFIVDPAPPVALTIGSTAKESEDLMVLGYPFRESLQWSSGCTGRGSIDAANPRFEHNCDTLPGHSGSPVLDANNLSVVGIHDGGDSVNYGTPLAATPVHRLLKALAETQSPLPESLNFGPFGANENRLLLTIPRKSGAFVSFTTTVDVEDRYDRVTIVDGMGRSHELTGKQQKALANLPTPVTVVFVSDYAGPSQAVAISSLQLSAD